MSGHKYLADTNTLIFLLDQHPSLLPLLDSEWHFCLITEIELLGKPGITAREIRSIRALLDICKRVDYSNEIRDLTITLRQKNKVKIPDALIAATAISANLPLLTFDKGFIKIDQLDVILLEI